MLILISQKNLPHTTFKAYMNETEVPLSMPALPIASNPLVNGRVGK